MPRQQAPSGHPADSTPTVARVKSRRRRDQDLRIAAAHVFYTKGYAYATMQDIADLVGIRKGSLYYYIETKEDLLYSLVAEMHDGLDQMMSAVTSLRGLSAGQQLKLYVRRHVEYNVCNPTQISIYYRDAGQLTRGRHEEIVARQCSHERQLVSLILRAQADGDIVADLDARMLSQVTFATIVGSHTWYRPWHDVSSERLVDTCVQFVLYGLKGTECSKDGLGS
jgi:TetR/AcrR family transcriptional regulator, cholesterol catabolism regulator